MNKFESLEIEQKANSFRIENGYGLNEPIDLESLIIKNNVITIFKPLSSDFAGMAIKVRDQRFMMINQTQIIARQNFTIGHELYHLFLQESFTSKKCETGLFDKQEEIEERRADYFSACLLLPKTGMYRFIPNEERERKDQISTETLFKIQQYYKLSIKSVIYRLNELGYVGRAYFDKYQTGLKIIARQLGYDIKLFEPGNTDKVIGDYGPNVSRLFREGKISESYYFELLNAINIDPFVKSDNDDNE